jgi:hypothetical protein
MLIIHKLTPSCPCFCGASSPTTSPFFLSSTLAKPYFVFLSLLLVNTVEEEEEEEKL